MMTSLLSRQLDAALLERYLAGEATDQERARVDAWLAAEPSRQATVHALHVALRDIGEVPADVEAVWKTLLPAVKQSDRNPSQWTRLRNSKGEVSGKTARLYKSQMLRQWARAIGGVIGVALVVLLFQWKTASRAGVTTTYTTHTGQRARVTLTDGTRMVLAPQTTARLVQFGSRSRRVMLDGEAYFDVSQSHGTPFIVQTGSVATRVLGTTFLVRHYRNDPRVRVVVASGKVTMTSQTARHPTLTLTAGDAGEVHDSLATVRTVDDFRAEMGWLKDELVFNDAPVSAILATLSRWYGYEFRCVDSALMRENITVGLSTRSSAKALAMLQQLLNVSLTVSGDTVTLLPRRTHNGPRNQKYRPYNVWTPSREVGR